MLSIKIKKLSKYLTLAIILVSTAGCNYAPQKPVQPTPGPTLEAITVQINDGVIRGRIGKTMDKNDQKRALHTLKKYKTKRVNSWRNKSTRIKYRFVVTKTLRSRKKKTLCKDYRVSATVDQLKRTMRGRVCRDRKGTWYAKHWNR